MRHLTYHEKLWLVLHWLPVAVAIAIALLSAGCGTMGGYTDRAGITQSRVLSSEERAIDTNGDGVTDAWEITENIERRLSPKVTEAAQTAARSVAPGPWGEIAAAGLGLIATFFGGREVIKRVRKS